MDESAEKLKGEIERQVVKEVGFPKIMTYEWVERWSDGIPKYDKADPTKPEWRATPVIPLDLTRDGYGEVLVKNEADPQSNRTKTIKDRAAWELAGIPRDFARALWLKIRHGELTKADLERIAIPRFSLITAGNEGLAIARCFAEYGLAPPKFIMDLTTAKPIIEALKKERADIYLTDLSQRALSPEDILQLSNNQGGIETTSQLPWFEPQAVFYDWHVHEAFNERPGEIYVPYGSGRLMENYLTWQARTLRNDREGGRDPRLRVPTHEAISMNILGARPKDEESIADKLTAKFRPFLIFKDSDISALVRLAWTGSDSGVHPVSEERIREAHQFLTRHGIEAEPSAAASLALYLDRFKQRLIKGGSRVLVVNTGKGLEAKQE